jgi:hypothetical protein
MAPLCCDTKGRKITFNEAEAERVRAIFRTYLKLGSLNLLMADLRKRNIVTKLRSLKTDRPWAASRSPAGRSPACFAIASMSGRSNSTHIEPVSGVPKRKLENGEQRLAPRSH